MSGDGQSEVVNEAGASTEVIPPKQKKAKKVVDQSQIDAELAAKIKSRRDDINVACRFAYVLNMTYPSSGLKFMAKIAGQMDGDEGELDNRKAMTRNSQILRETYSAMTNPEITFREQFGEEHSWDVYFVIPADIKQKITYPAFDIDPDTPMVQYQDPLKKMKALLKTFKTHYCDLSARTEMSGAKNDKELWGYRLGGTGGVFVDAIICRLLYKDIIDERNNGVAPTNDLLVGTGSSGLATPAASGGAAASTAKAGKSSDVEMKGRDLKAQQILNTGRGGNPSPTKQAHVANLGIMAATSVANFELKRVQTQVMLNAQAQEAVGVGLQALKAEADMWKVLGFKGKKLEDLQAAMEVRVNALVAENKTVAIEMPPPVVFDLTHTTSSSSSSSSAAGRKNNEEEELPEDMLEQEEDEEEEEVNPEEGDSSDSED
jgi:hypothetical protein